MNHFSNSLNALIPSTKNTENGEPNNGWYSFYAPIARLDPDGNLSSNDQGSWAMLGNAYCIEDIDAGRVGFSVSGVSTDLSHWNGVESTLLERTYPIRMLSVPSVFSSTHRWASIVSGPFMMLGLAATTSQEAKSSAAAAVDLLALKEGFLVSTCSSPGPQFVVAITDCRGSELSKLIPGLGAPNHPPGSDVQAPWEAVSPRG